MVNYLTKLIIARHGNTFNAGDTPTRVGARTDLPLVEKGHEQAKALGRYLKEHDLTPDAVYCSSLKRTKETAELALREMGVREHVYALDIFNEIDYGIDENMSEDKVIARIGKEAIENWDKHAIAPDGWDVNPDEIVQNWLNFSNQIAKTHDEITNHVLDIREVILVVTSNGIARFAPHITDDFKGFSDEFSIKLSTGALGILEQNQGKWRVTGWNIKPSLK